MNVEAVIDELNAKYPGKTIVTNNQDNPTEILCEVDPSEKHPSFSLAVSVIDKSVSHVHKKLTEVYTVVKGKLTVHLDRKTIELNEKDNVVIHPHQVHWAEGNETWVECYSRPGWTASDHIF